MEKSLRLGFLGMNNEAEYEALLAGMALVKNLEGEVIEVYSNSQLVVGQVSGEFEARDERMQGYLVKWGLDIAGPFPQATGNRKWLLVETEYFTKWVEAEPLSNIKDVDAKRFIWRNIITRFRVLHTLILDNRLQFDSKAFRRYYRELGIRNRYSTHVYPQGNGQAETANKAIVFGLKKKIR
ncbi:uncharacterized protein LOC112007375 [Quercus suber]|uniref:uncharacterized protein LOC112007375 n=1 Tax=Quercus suber TaxID=58331 RepID=UPI000CE27B51|nr:uncharacterized protein LOC112007375 [Quercus suber]